ncbi:hypothetical protein H0X48_02660 [Candidatus Dependentiae bacterium]|nr:hypothetical protein [Candidatus Dependentiae bacterium]
MQVAIKLNELKNAWIESLKLLLPVNLKPLLLVSLKSVSLLLDTVRLLPSSVTAALVISFLVVPLVVVIKNTPIWQPIAVLLAYCCYITVLLVAATRASVEYKKSSYFTKRLIYILPALALTLVLDAMFVLVTTVVPQWLVSGIFFITGLSNGIAPFYVFSLLFLMDSRMSIKEWINALGRALLFVVYNYPFFFIVYNLVKVGSLSVSLVLEKYMPILLFQVVSWYVFLGVFVPIFICFLTTVYSKQIHEQFGLYYNS